MVQSNRNKFAISDKFSIGDGGVISNRRLVQVSYYLKSRDKYIHKAAEAFLEYDTIQQIRKGSPAYIYVEIRTGFRSGNFRRFCFFYSVEILERNHPSSSTRMIINGRR